MFLIPMNSKKATEVFNATYACKMLKNKVDHFLNRKNSKECLLETLLYRL